MILTIKNHRLNPPSRSYGEDGKERRLKFVYIQPKFLQFIKTIIGLLNGVGLMFLKIGGFQVDKISDFSQFVAKMP